MACTCYCWNFYHITVIPEKTYQNAPLRHLLSSLHRYLNLIWCPTANRNSARFRSFDAHARQTQSYLAKLTVTRRRVPYFWSIPSVNITSDDARFRSFDTHCRQTQSYQTSLCQFSASPSWQLHDAVFHISEVYQASISLQTTLVT